MLTTKDSWTTTVPRNQRGASAGPKDMAAQHFATAGYFAPGRDISMADHMLDVVIRSQGVEVAELVELYGDSQVAASDRMLMHDLASAASEVSPRCARQVSTSMASALF